MTEKVWGGRFRERINEMVDAFNSSIHFDRRLYGQDIEGTIAHCRMLAKQEIITDDEASRIVDALAEIRREMDRGQFPANDEHEDIHTLIEKALIEKVGMIGEKVHAGRSRNDQVSLDVRMYVRGAIERVTEMIRGAQGALVHLAEENIEGHLQISKSLHPPQDGR